MNRRQSYTFDGYYPPPPTPDDTLEMLRELAASEETLELLATFALADALFGWLP